MRRGGFGVATGYEMQRRARSCCAAAHGCTLETVSTLSGCGHMWPQSLSLVSALIVGSR
jgi:hypothetical protein